MKIKLLLICLVFLMINTNCKKKSIPEQEQPQQETPDENLPDVELKTRIVTSNLNLPWEIIYGPDNMIWMTEKLGRISRVNPTSGQVTTLLNVGDVIGSAEGGLLGMALHPDFTANPYVYVVYCYGANYKEKVVRYTYANNILTSPQTLLDEIPAAGAHNGSRLVISGGKIYISTGDAQNQSLPQNTNSLAGKILRINLDGSIPADNPMPDNPLWSLGHRNPQGLVMVGSKLFSSEHGANNDDEVNIIEKGRNYGWPNVAGLCDEAGESTFCIQNNVAEPLIKWTPTIAPAGLDYYNSNYIPQFKNSLLLSLLKASKMMQLKLDAAQTRIVETKDFYVNTFGRLRDFAISPEGKIYICTSNGNDTDRIIEIYK